MLPYIDNNGVIDTSRIRHRHWQQQSTGAKAQPWMMCDPTDLPSIPPLDINTTAEAQISVLIGQLEGDEMAGLYKSELGHINLQLHTPPDSPTESIKDTRTFGDFNDNSTQSSAAAPVHSLLSLPPHIVLEIVSNLYMPDIRSLSLTCTAFRRYLCAESHIWPLMCRSKLTYTPRFLHRHQSAAYYLHVRGNDRLENLVLLQRARVENVIQQIASP
ncbi:hypothetical protein GQ54DRAFT_262567 [Martensiomyces pterosporus]|nr:hypothetical protein GQ54DRAFT_262567 [Martensiomyces pterosporus]